MRPKDTVQRNRHYRCLEYDHDQSGELCLVACGIERCDPGVVFGPEVRDCYHLHAVLSGQGVLYVRGQELRPQAGQLFLLKDGEEVRYVADLCEPWRYCWVTYSGTNAGAISEEMGFGEGVYCLDSTVDVGQFYDLVVKMHEKPQMDRVNDLRRRGILLEYLALAMEATTAPGARFAHERSTAYYIQRAVDFINLNYTTITVADVVKYIGFDRSYFSAAFKKQAGMSPQEYIIKMRLENSIRLLTHTEWSVQQIAARVGYDDQLAFTRVFKRYYGVSPTKYRAQLDEQGG